MGDAKLWQQQAVNGGSLNKFPLLPQYKMTTNWYKEDANFFLKVPTACVNFILWIAFFHTTGV